MLYFANLDSCETNSTFLYSIENVRMSKNSSLLLQFIIGFGTGLLGASSYDGIIQKEILYKPSNKCL